MKFKKFNIFRFFFPAILLCIFAACEQNYDKADLYSAHEIVTREAKAEELVWAFHHAGLSAVSVTAGYPETAVDPKNPEPGPPEDQNEIVLKGGTALPGTIIPFVFIPEDAEDPLKTFEGYHKRRARGLAIWRLGRPEEPPLNDARFEPLYRYLEIHGVPVFVSIANASYLDELSTVILDHPNLKIIGGGLLGMRKELPRLRRVLEAYNNLLVDIGFDGDPGFEQVFRDMAAESDITKDFFDNMYQRILFSAGLVYDHRLYRRGQWGVQIFNAYRSFLEKAEFHQRLRDEKGKWRPVDLKGLVVAEDHLKKIYNENFRKVIGMSFHDPIASDLHLLKVEVPEVWSYDPVSPTRLIAVLVAPKAKLVSGISTQRLRDLFAGKLKDWREINGEPGPIRIASYSNLAKIIADQLDAPLVADVVNFHNLAETQSAIEREGDMIGIIPIGSLNGRLDILTVDGENPALSNVQYCATKSAPTISNYFATYPLIVPVSYPAYAAGGPGFDPFEIRTVLIGGEVRAPRNAPAPVIDEKEKDKDLLGLQMKPVYDILPAIRKADFAAFVGPTPNDREAFLLRVLGARALITQDTVNSFGPDMGAPASVLESRIRGKSIRIVVRTEDLTGEGIEILALTENATDAQIRLGLDAGAAAVLAGGSLGGIKNLGVTRAPLGKFLGDEGAAGAYVTFSFLGDKLLSAQVVPVATEGGIVQRRYGKETRSMLLSAYGSIGR